MRPYIMLVVAWRCLKPRTIRLGGLWKCCLGTELTFLRVSSGHVLLHTEMLGNHLL